jgi:hypothetical protein
MDDATLTPEEERELREALAGDAGVADLKGDFCNCWPVAKRLLERLAPRLPERLRKAIALVIAVCDEVCKEG